MNIGFKIALTGGFLFVFSAACIWLAVNADFEVSGHTKTVIGAGLVLGPIMVLLGGLAAVWLS